MAESPRPTALVGVDGDNVRVLELSVDLRLPGEACLVLALVHVTVDELDRDLAEQATIPAELYNTHAALAERTAELEALLECACPRPINLVGACAERYRSHAHLPCSRRDLEPVARGSIVVAEHEVSAPRSTPSSSPSALSAAAMSARDLTL